jgi:hypothetical protein
LLLAVAVTGGVSAWAVVLASGAVLFTRKSAMAQALARGVAWSVILPTAVVALLAWSHGFYPGVRVLLPAAAAAGALVLARPMLDRDEARATFAPIALRSWLLASATAALGAGLAIAQLATAFAGVHLFHYALALGAVALSLLASGIGVVRMRAWGVLVGAVSSFAATAVAFRFGLRDVIGWPVLASAIPGVMMTVGVLAARARYAHASTNSAVREHESLPASSRIRVDGSAAGGTSQAPNVDAHEPATISDDAEEDVADSPATYSHARHVPQRS